MSPPLLRPMLNANQNTNIVTTGFTRAHDHPKAEPLYVLIRSAFASLKICFLYALCSKKKSFISRTFRTFSLTCNSNYTYIFYTTDLIFQVNNINSTKTIQIFCPIIAICCIMNIYRFYLPSSTGYIRLFILSFARFTVFSTGMDT